MKSHKEICVIFFNAWYWIITACIIGTHYRSMKQTGTKYITLYFRVQVKSNHLLQRQMTQLIKTDVRVKECSYGPLSRYVQLRVAHAPGMLGTLSPPPRISDPDMHHGTCVTHVPWCMPGSLTSGFFWSRWWGKRSRHSRSMHSPQFYLSGKRPIVMHPIVTTTALDSHLGKALNPAWQLRKTPCTHDGKRQYLLSMNWLLY